MAKTNYQKQMEEVIKHLETPKERVDYNLYKITSRNGRIFISWTKSTLDELRESILNDKPPYDILMDIKMNERIKLEKETILIEFIGKIEEAQDLSVKDIKKYVELEYKKELDKNQYVSFLSSYRATIYRQK